MAQSTGYHQLADLMGPYAEAAIFRRFGPLAMLSLLSLQAELVELDAEFRKICQEDDQSVNEADKNFSKYFRALRRSEEGGTAHQYEKLMEIRSKLNEYCAHALFTNSSHAGLTNINRLCSASSSANIKAWASNSVGTRLLEKVDADIFGKRRLDRDLVSLYARPSEQDLASESVTTHLLTWFHKLWGSKSSARKQSKGIDPLSGAMDYNKETLLRLNTILISVISAAMPVLSIIALYYIKSTIERIGALVVIYHGIRPGTCDFHQCTATGDLRNNFNFCCR
ncbi:hypothetical protein M409DRAFT_25134 [Zasmidium cellare ATCC 36951]|uniref:DUF6594 domain-containing protein n=1 Tax=Zasmidium cellare ATCC 36951 TaxID=1080233 RepID=A0A6A6CCH4_ZASCE|nr:uncharacterized protein M409DRAFT_25134 [Zasmidium cellare ATCC 36951]KAF2164741.1 hypothetical protein M409DRAFT_25134 [Zasmidium cellare ATCC 36951]